MNKAKQLFDAFKRLAPNSADLFEPTPANLHRWQFHVDNISQTRRPQYELDRGPLEILSEQRAIFDWNGFDTVTAMRYTIIAGLFPGRQVFACGSRVRGDYIDANSPPFVLEARKLAGKATKDESDYDFFIPGPHIEPVNQLPKWADYVRHIAPDETIIQIPMWNFDKIPAGELQAVRHMVSVADIPGLVNIHNKYRLSDWQYSPCCEGAGVLKWFQWGLENGKLDDRN